MKLKTLFLSALPLFVPTAHLMATNTDGLHVVQQSGKRISGVVTDHTGEPVIGANVSIKGTTTGTITDLDGKFSLDVPANATLLISYIGYTA